MVPPDDESAARVPDPGARCPCGTGRTYGECCGPIHAGLRPAATAEQLMRSRYSAFAVGDAGYLARSWHPTTRPRRVRVHPDDVWLGLEVRRTERGGLADDEGIVEFVARCRRGGDEMAVAEVSRFVRHEGAWVYVGAAGPPGAGGRP